MIWQKIIDLAADIRFRIVVAVLSLIPPLGMVLKYFYVIDEDYNIVTFSALEFREIFSEHQGDLGMLVAAFFGPLFKGIFVVSVIAGLAAIGLSFIRKKAAAITAYALTMISGYAPTLSLAFIMPLFEETAAANLMVMLGFILLGTCMCPVSLGGLVLSAISKNYK